MRGAPTSRKNSSFGVRFANELSASRTQPCIAFAMLVLIRRRWPKGDQLTTFLEDANADYDLRDRTTFRIGNSANRRQIHYRFRARCNRIRSQLDQRRLS